MRVAFVLVELRRMGRQLAPLTQPGLDLTRVHKSRSRVFSALLKLTLLLELYKPDE